MPVPPTPPTAAPKAASAAGAANAPTNVKAAAAPPAPPAAAAPAVAAADQPIRYQHYQSPATMSISVLAKNLTADDVVVDIQPTHLRVVVVSASGKRREEVVIDKELFGTVDVSRSKFTIYKTKVEILLTKEVQGIWPSIEYTGGPRPLPSAASATAATSSSSSSTAPSSSTTAAADTTARPKAYATHRDWDKVGSEINKELDAEKPEGEEALNHLFQQIYKDADPETRMAMKKSFQTSGGTVLSTNWKEVAQKNYEEERQVR